MMGQIRRVAKSAVAMLAMRRFVGVLRFLLRRMIVIKRALPISPKRMTGTKETTLAIHSWSGMRYQISLGKLYLLTSIWVRQGKAWFTVWEAQINELRKCRTSARIVS